jgi:hypothetical protein
MKIRFRQSGGVAGVSKVAEVDSAGLPAHEEERLRGMVDQALGAPVPPPETGMPDEEQYYIEIQTTEIQQTIIVTHSSVPPALNPLVHYLTSIARYEARRKG